MTNLIYGLVVVGSISWLVFCIILMIPGYDVPWALAIAARVTVLSAAMLFVMVVAFTIGSFVTSELR